MREITITSHSPEQTIALGRALGRQLAGGEVIAIVGPLGSGKTHLIKGIAEGAGAADRREVNSPTFVLVNHYAGRLDLYHIDAYRLDLIAEFERLGFDDLCYPESVVLIEWADRVEPAIAATNPMRITLAHAGPRARTIRIADLPPHVKVPE
ncbi:MAG: tRNA (adenosine(37)-N6)-threonylcarbamoyltransferase complex ATPase subunit type 1 TsaE [Phycisphaerae bacterium]|nr:tRNA (adenosine(37)-N6)-threonylcarbamoyltransferase complex ATPase subunit type 1 TsaE [Phycisphaerae bacterium]